MLFVSHEKHSRAVGLVILTTFFWGFAAPLIKLALHEGASVWQINFIRGLLGVVFLSVLWPRKEWSLRTVPEKSRMVFGITVLMDGFTTVLFALLASTTSSLNTVTLFMTAPLFAFFFEWIIWRTRVSRKEIFAFLFLILGVLMMVYSGEGGLSAFLSTKSIVMGLVGGLISGLILVGLEKVEHGVPVKTTVYWSLVSVVLLSMPLGLPDMFIFPVTTQGILALVALGIFVQALASFSLTSALKYLHAGETAVLESFQIVFVLIAGMLIGEFPTLLQFMGAATVAGAAALVARAKKG